MDEDAVKETDTAGATDSEITKGKIETKTPGEETKGKTDKETPNEPNLGITKNKQSEIFDFKEPISKPIILIQ